jgi:hypothetical protein
MNVILAARVSSVTGKTVHGLGTIADGKPEVTNVLPAPDWVGIAREKDGYFLLHFNSESECVADTWHESLEAAKRQAEFEFNISDSDWTEGSNPPQ